MKTVVLLIKIKIYSAEKHVEGNIYMNIEYYRKLIEDLPIGYAYHKIICSHAGNPVDYEYIEVNSAFEKFTGLNRTKILGKKVCDLFPDLLINKFNWIQEYGEIALNGGRKEFEQYSFLLNKWFRISVSSHEKYYFTTFLVDITDGVNELHKQKVLMNAMNDAVFVINDSLVVENVIAPDGSDILASKDQIIGKLVSDLLPKNVASLILSAIKNTRETKKKEIVEYPFTVSSEERWFKAEVKYIEINDTHIYVTNISDITEQKQSEIKLKNKTLELDRFFSVNLDLLCIADTNGNLIAVITAGVTGTGEAISIAVGICHRTRIAVSVADEFLQILAGHSADDQCTVVGDIGFQYRIGADTEGVIILGGYRQKFKLSH